MKAFYYPLFFLLIGLGLNAQSYDISQYQARYERRPFLELNPSLNYNGSFSDRDDFTLHSGGANLIVDWREESNLDQRIRSFSISGRAQFSRQEYKSNNFTDRSQKGASLVASMEQYKYFTENQFWGFRGDVSLNAQEQDDLQLNSNRFTNLSIRPGFFYGLGRIEFAQDALLANWMMDDLLAEQVISTATPEQRESLARRITSIIGNRTFDFRRRRIYELQQLQQLFAEENMSVDNDFLLFAVLNDNWAFANRAVLPRGQRWQFGVDAGGFYQYRSQPFADDQFVLEGRPYVQFSSGKIVGNNASRVWSAQVGAYYQDFTDQNNPLSPFFQDERYGATLQLSYRYVWLPISRTTISWTNSLATQLGRATFQGSSSDFTENLVFLNSGLTCDYFVSNNWRFVLNIGVNGQLLENDLTDFYTVRPYFNFSTRYAIF